MILWEKQATPAWLAANEPHLELLAVGNLAVISQPGKLRRHIQIICPRQTDAARLVQRFGGAARPMAHDWLGKFQRQSARPPIRVGRRLKIVSESERVDRTHLVIPAAGAFGTGDHATTAMSLRLLEETTRHLAPGWRLLDAGTGTGILALAARRFGAAEILGIDNDRRAVAHARQNARLNRITRTRFLAADFLQWKPTARYEVVTANLFSELLIAAMPILHRALRAKGCLIVSGILRQQVPEVRRALSQAGFAVAQERRRGKWIALRATRKT